MMSAHSHVIEIPSMVWLKCKKPITYYTQTRHKEAGIILDTILIPSDV